MSWQASPETDENLIAARDFIAADNEQPARDFLDAAFVGRVRGRFGSS